MKIGEDVLSKIEKLITQIDLPKTRKIPTPRIEQRQYDNQLYNKLYQQHKTKLIKHSARLQQKKQNQIKSCSPFKVTNKHSIFLNSQQPRKPLHQRIEELQNRKKEELMLLRQKYMPKQTEEQKEDNQIQQQMEDRRRTQRKFTQKQVVEKVEQLRKKQKDRLQRLNRLKIEMIEEHSKGFRCKPYVSKQTQNLWNRYKLKKQLSASVFERFEQYEIDRKTHLENTEKEVRSRITPFAPRISQHSRLIASRSASKLDTKSKTMERTLSCKCLVRHKKHHISTALHTSRKI